MVTAERAPGTCNGVVWAEPHGVQGQSLMVRGRERALKLNAFCVITT